MRMGLQSLVERMRKQVNPSDRSGTLQRSILPVALSTGTSTTVGIRTDPKVPYAAAQEEGGTIQGKTWLAIPLDPIRSSGKPLFTSPRQDGSITHIWRSPAGNLFLAGRNGRSMQLRWLLTRQVKIQGQGYMRKVTERSVREVPGIIKDTLVDMVCE